MVKRKISNPLALAVLAVLAERSMHPYEMATTLRGRGKERSIRINYGSLYTVVDSLARAGFIRPIETYRDGRRPERTIYALTEAGDAELHDWLRHILRTPSKEYPEFEAGLSLLPVLPPEEVAILLKEREQLLLERIAEAQELIGRMAENGLGRLFTVEHDYGRMLLQAELCWVRDLMREIGEGSFDGLPTWRRWQAKADVGKEEHVT